MGLFRVRSILIYFVFHFMIAMSLWRTRTLSGVRVGVLTQPNPHPKSRSHPNGREKLSEAPLQKLNKFVTFFLQWFTAGIGLFRQIAAALNPSTANRHCWHQASASRTTTGIWCPVKGRKYKYYIMSMTGELCPLLWMMCVH